LVDESAMRAFMRGQPHRRAMGKLAKLVRRSISRALGAAERRFSVLAQGMAAHEGRGPVFRRRPSHPRAREFSARGAAHRPLEWRSAPQINEPAAAIIRYIVPIRPGMPAMIKNYSDHAANERTFLAWVRTAIAVMAFGFVIEKFDLFLRAVASQAVLEKVAPHGQKFANAAGLAFIAIGVAMIVLAGIRFAWTAKAIASEEQRPNPGERFDLVLAGLIGLLGASLFLYMASAVFPAQ
jgi:putative membrane protein